MADLPNTLLGFKVTIADHLPPGVVEFRDSLTGELRGAIIDGVPYGTEEIRAARKAMTASPGRQ